MEPENEALETREMVGGQAAASGEEMPSAGGETSVLPKRRLITAGRVGLLFSVIPYLGVIFTVLLVALFYFILGKKPEHRKDLIFLLCSASVLGVAGVFLSFRAVICNTVSRPKANKTEFILGIIGISLFSMNLLFPIGIGFALYPMSRYLEPARRDAPRDQAADSLRRLYMGFAEYAKASPEKCFPALSHEPGKLMHGNIELFIHEWPSVYAVPGDPEYKSLLHSPEYLHGKTPAVDDWRFFYLGYEIRSEAEMAAFVRMYRQAYSNGKWLEGDLTCSSGPPEYQEHIIPHMNIRLPSVAPDAKRPPLPREHSAKIPVCIERIENNGNRGGHVLFLDGHVEYIEYPGRWPMTEQTVAWLNDMDKMGPPTGAT